MTFTNKQILELIDAYYGYTFPSQSQLDEAIDFRVPKEGELFIPASYTNIPTSTIVTGTIYAKRLILKKAKQVVPGDTKSTFTPTVQSIYNKNQVEIPDGYSYVAFRPARVRETFIDPDSLSVYVSSIDWKIVPRIIVKKNEG